MSYLLLALLLIHCLLGGIIAVLIQPLYHAKIRFLLQPLINCRVHTRSMLRSRYLGPQLLLGYVLCDKLLIEDAGPLALIGIYVLTTSARCS